MLRCRPACATCGEEYPDTVDVILDRPYSGDLIGQLDPADPAANAEVYARFDQAITDYNQAVQARDNAINAFREQHRQCPDDVPAVEAPAVDPNPRASYRLPFFRTQRG